MPHSWDYTSVLCFPGSNTRLMFGHVGFGAVLRPLCEMRGMQISNVGLFVYVYVLMNVDPRDTVLLRFI